MLVAPSRSSLGRISYLSDKQVINKDLQEEDLKVGINTKKVYISGDDDI